MSAPTNPPPGLRERKKIKLHRAIQTAALRLFETRGYEHTTVEQIAEAAETSTTTFYRYFPTKEDVVLDNDASPRRSHRRHATRRRAPDRDHPRRHGRGRGRSRSRP
jgi:AcrR family transcriptional regulator